jgi:hypothetical protein
VQEAREELAAGARLIAHEEIKREFGSRERPAVADRLHPPPAVTCVVSIPRFALAWSWRLSESRATIPVLTCASLPAATSCARVGDWRVRFRREIDSRELLVLRMLPRGRAYDR